MKKAFTLLIAMFIVLSSLSFASAAVLVAGKIYNADFSATIEGADVSVTCNHPAGENAGNYTLSDISNSDGTYGVKFPETYDVEEELICGIGDEVTVSAVKGALSGEEKGIVWDGEVFGIDLGLGVVNVPLIPEFGFIVGGLTLISALAVFFVIRRR